LLYDIIFEGILTTALLVPKSFHSTVDWQEGFFKHLGEVAAQFFWI